MPYHLRLVLSLWFIASASVSGHAEAPMTCSQIGGLIGLLKYRHAAAGDPVLRERRLTEDRFAESLSEGFAEALDPSQQILLASEVDHLRGLGVAEIKDKVFARGDCEAFEAAHRLYLQAIARSLRLIPALGTDPDPLEADVMTLVKRLTLAGRSEVDRWTNQRGWSVTKGDLVAQVKLNLATAVVLHDAEISDREAYTEARAQFDHERLNPITRAKLPELMSKVVLSHVDSHSGYLDERDLNQMFRSLREFGGIGITGVSTDGGIAIRTLIPGGGAAQSGRIKVGDKITRVNGRSVLGVEFADVAEMLQGPIGTTVDLDLKRTGEAEPFVVTVTRGSLNSNATLINGELVGSAAGPLAYVRFREFNEDTASGLKAAVSELSDRGARGLVLDLRDNPGGILEEALSIIQHFESRLPATGAYLFGARQKRATRLSLNREQRPFSGPLVVLVNQGSASASELVSGALQAYGRALVVGNSSTYGKGSMQEIAPVSEHAKASSQLLLKYVFGALPPGGLTLTTAFYYLPDGRSVQGVGVEPDVRLYPDRVDATAPTEMSSSRYSLPTPQRLPPTIGPSELDLKRLANYRAHFAPLRDRLAAEFAARKSEFATGEDPERQAALFLLERWVGSLVPAVHSELTAH